MKPGELSRYCLNLDRRPDRRLRTWAQFRKQGLEVERIAAPDARVLGDGGARGWRNAGNRACALGHRLAWREGRRGGRAVLVFEDDVVLCGDFRARFEALEVPDDWGIFYAGCIFRDVPEPVAPGVVRVTGRTWETHAMAVHPRVFGRLHGLLAPWSRRRGPRVHPIAGSEIAIDNLMAEIHREERVYAAYPALAWQAYGLSNIENGVRGLWREDGRQRACAEVIDELERRLGNVVARDESIEAMPA